MRPAAVSLFLMLVYIGKLMRNTSEELLGFETRLVMATLIQNSKNVFDVSFLPSAVGDV